MSTRYYLTKRYPSFLATGRWQGGWTSGPNHPAGYFLYDYTWLLSTDKTGGGLRSLRPAQSRNSNTPVDVLHHRFLTPPLDAQTIDGTLDLTVMTSVYPSGAGPTPAAVYKIYAYISVGQSLAVRTVLLDYVDSIPWAHGAVGTFVGLAAPQALTSAPCQAGDSIVVEIGCRLSVTGTYTSPIARPPNEYANVRLSVGTLDVEGGAVAADGVVGSTAGAASFVDFSATLTEQAPSGTIPTNIDGPSAIAIPSLPYANTQDTTRCGTIAGNRAVWYKYTATTTGRLFFTTFGSNYWAVVGAYTSASGSPGAPSVDYVGKQRFTSLCLWAIDLVPGTTYWFAVRSLADSNNAQGSGGFLRVHAFLRQAPANDDVIVASNGILARFTRAGVLADLSGYFSSEKISGLGFDYTHRPLIDIGNGNTVHTGNRIYLALFGTDIIEIMPVDDWHHELDYIDDPIYHTGGRDISALSINAAGLLAAGWFGNGFTRVAGYEPSSYMDAVATLGTAPIAVLDAAHGDNQAGAPFPLAVLEPAALDVGGTNYVEFAQDGTIVWYTSGGWYLPIGGQIVKRYNVVTHAQLADFATVPASTGLNPGLKGLFPLPNTPTTPGGGCLVCNGNEVRYLGPTGVTIRTYAPAGAVTLVDVEVTSDGTAFWTFDEATSWLYKYDIATGALLFSGDVHLGINEATSLVVYRVDPFVYPPCPCPTDPWTLGP